MSEIGYRELRRARRHVIAQAGAMRPGWGSADTMTPMVRYGLEVMGFEVAGAWRFAREIADNHAFRIEVAKGDYEIDLFAAAILSGVSYGAQAERQR